MEFVKSLFKQSSLPSLLTRLEGRAGDFQLISLRPYVSLSEHTLDMEKPHVFHTEAVRISHLPSAAAESVFGTESIGCADDIVYVSSKIDRNMEIKALGMNIRMKAALLEAARKTEAEHVKYIIFQDPMHKYHGKNSFVLENVSESGKNSKHALLISMDPNVPLRML
jgi:hypothetical protein